MTATMSAKKQGSVKIKEQLGAKEHDSTAAKMKEQVFMWIDNETELLLNVTLEFIVPKVAKNVEWEWVRSKYHDI